MDRYRSLEFACAAAAVVVITLWAPSLENTQAQSLPSKPPVAVKHSVAQLTPLPVYSIFPPAVLDRIAQKTTRHYWSVPEPQTWPLRPDGHPKVSTERMNRMFHTVEEGQSLRRIRNMYRVSTSKLQKLNPDTDLESLEGGERLLVWKRNPRRYGVSYGAPHWGRLFHSEPLPKDDNYVILFHYRTFGTYYTVSEVKRVMDAYYEKYPDSHKLMIGDISFRKGGKIYPHKSHRTGRDIDISFPRNNGPPPNYDRFHYVRRDELDVDKTLFLIKEFIDSGYVEYIFMSRWFQKKLRREAKERGAPKAWLDKVFEYPDWGGDAIVKHEPGHRNHMHIRFHCQPTDRRCR